MCTISIIMGVYNCADTLPQAISSLLSQTFRDWELVICDDGSTDGSYRIAQDFQCTAPHKITLLRNGDNLGLAVSLNRCLDAARGTYIARMDADDLCSPNRLELELAALENAPELAFVSTDMTLFDENGSWGRVSHPTDPKPRDFVRGTPFCHAPCLIRADALKAVGGYDTGRHFLRVEDYHLWLKLYCAGYRGRNLHLPLYQMRDDRDACRRRTLRYRLNEARVAALAVRQLHLPVFYLLYATLPVLKGILPRRIGRALHRMKRHSPQA